MRLSIYTLFFTLVFWSCSPKKPVDRSGYTEERAQRELKRVLPADLIAQGEKIGKSVIELTAAQFQDKLKNAIVESGIDGAVTYCNINAMNIVKELEDSLGVSISRVTDRNRNPANTLNDLEKEIWEAYNYAPGNTDVNIQEYDRYNLIATKAIHISSTLCLNCHGTIGDQIAESTYALLQEKYPKDVASGYALGDLRGMWSVIIPKASIVSQL